jgi:fructose-1,6-bisphosphatase
VKQQLAKDVRDAELKRLQLEKQIEDAERRRRDFARKAQEGRSTLEKLTKTNVGSNPFTLSTVVGQAKRFVTQNQRQQNSSLEKEREALERQLESVKRRERLQSQIQKLVRVLYLVGNSVVFTFVFCVCCCLTLTLHFHSIPFHPHVSVGYDQCHNGNHRIHSKRIERRRFQYEQQQQQQQQ